MCLLLLKSRTVLPGLPGLRGGRQGAAPTTAADLAAHRGWTHLQQSDWCCEKCGFRNL